MEEVSFCWKNITASAQVGPPFRKKKKVILDNVSGYVNKGELLAVMGPSAAGKSTLMNALSFQNLNGINLDGGTRYANGVPMTPQAMTSISGYIIQEDLFIGTLTVKEHLTFLSNLRLGGEFSKEQKAEKVATTMRQLNLTKCANTLIGVRGRVKGISGGEMRRLSFASEALADPPLMLADEPTTGLDSWMAENVISLMRTMCERGRTIICVIHQPSSELFRLFDRLILLSEGRVAYMGALKSAAPFFESIGHPCPAFFNPADHFIHKLSMTPRQEEEYLERTETICRQFAESEHGAALSAELRSHVEDREGRFDNAGFELSSLRPYKSPWLQQFGAVLWRSWHSVSKDPIIARIRIVEAVGLALLVGTIYFGQGPDYDQAATASVSGALFWATTNQAFLNYGAVLGAFCIEIPVFIREHSAGTYRTDVYFLTKQLADLPIFLLTPVLFMSIYYWMVGFYADVYNFITTVIIIILVSQAAIGMGYMSSCLSPNLAVALAVGPTIFIPLMNFGGFYQNAGSIPVWLDWMKYISLWFYGFEALSINQWKNVEEIKCEFEEAVCAEDGMDVLNALNFKEENLALDMALLGALAVGFRAVGFVALLWRARRK